MGARIPNATDFFYRFGHCKSTYRCEWYEDKGLRMYGSAQAAASAEARLESIGR